ncbi:MAG: fibronectin type III-like domain-contianing protein [Oscillospiraceae bacterium]|nr:fibronectin type III-like domain-contianing protein [Oscillospiraceae bacterium]MBR0392756.1 fibronectin type III-like domain-contianing protein [Oscillospiraceae bacterium]
MDLPLRQLCGFKRVSLAVGEEKTVEITIPMEKLKWYNPVHRTWELENMTYRIYAGSSEALADLKATEIAL